VCNTKSKIVHDAILETYRCKLEDIKTEEREIFTSLMKAIMEGYTACPHCIGNRK
jgi:DNA replication initiation complex subunit (GINS family)